MVELNSVPQIVTLWWECKRGIKLELIREEMARILRITEYNKDVFYDKFRRDPPTSTNYQLDELLALVRAFQAYAPSCVSANHAIKLFDLAKMPLDHFRHLKTMFAEDEFDVEWRAYLLAHNLFPSPIKSQQSMPLLPEQEKFIVGRDAEIAEFERFLQPDYGAAVYEIYGPGGIGKSVVAEKFRRYAVRHALPFAFVDGNTADLTPTRMLSLIADGFARTESLADFFGKFETEYTRYSVINRLLSEAGGIDSIYDVLGKPKDSSYLRAALTSSPQAEHGDIERTLANRFGLERYLRGAETLLIEQLAESLGAAQAVSAKPLTLVIDTYEEMEGLDDWLCRDLLPKLQKRARIAILGRNALTKINFEWKELGSQLVQRPLPELSDVDTKAYLRHFGLSDPAALQRIYEYTGGYPLLLVLVCDLAREIGGWDALGTLENKGDQLSIAADLLARILREERVQEVRAFLEKGVVVDWFDAEIVSVVLDVSYDEGRIIYDKLRRHSFVERHPFGLKFHDVIKEILRKRLSDVERAAIRERVQAYHLSQSGRYGG